MNTIRIRLATLALLAMVPMLAFDGCAYRAAVRPSHLAAYRGEGTISEIQNVFNPGVKVVFEPFRLGHEFSAVYRIDGLPKRPSSYWVDLVVPDPGSDWRILSGQPIRIGVPGALRLSARSATGEVIFDCEWSPEEHGWSIGDGGAAAGYLDHVHSRPRVNETHIYPEAFTGPSGPATLEVVWHPDTGTPDKVAYIRMRSGGAK